MSRQKKRKGRKVLEGIDFIETAWDILVFIPRVLIRMVKDIW